MSFEIKEELIYLYQVLEELERKNEEKINRIEELKDEIEYIKKEKENLKKYIKEKEDEKVKVELEAEAVLDELSRQYIELQSLTQTQNNSYWNFGKVNAILYSPAYLIGRIIPVKNNGEPSEELGNSKWTKKK